MRNPVEDLFHDVTKTLQLDAIDENQRDSFDWNFGYDAGQIDDFDPNDQITGGVATPLKDYLIPPQDVSSRQLSAREIEIFESSIRTSGFDTLAFYKSWRHRNRKPFTGTWGIFYLERGLEFLAQGISASGYVPNASFELAIEFLHQHEFFHYKADIHVLQFEAILKKSLFLPLRRALRHRASHFVEEALANQAVWRWSKKKSINLEGFAESFMQLQPNAYGRYREKKLGLLNEWASGVLDQIPPYRSPYHRHYLAPFIDRLPAKYQGRLCCPEYVVSADLLSEWMPGAVVLPPVASIFDGPQVSKALTKSLSHLKNKWTQTKEKLIENRFLRGLNLKPWPNDGPNKYSVRVDDKYRAHLEHTGRGEWIAYALGDHKRMGHG